MIRYLVDKSALARMTHERVHQRLAPLIEAGEAATCSIVDLEVLFSARNHQDHEAIRARRELAYERVPSRRRSSTVPWRSRASLPGKGTIAYPSRT